MAACNSKVYYLITKMVGQSDRTQRLPLTGSDTVLDAISQLNALADLSIRKTWLVRPAAKNVSHEQVLSIDWDAITQGAETATNYQLLPGDRLYVSVEKRTTSQEVLRIEGIIGGGSTIPVDSTERHYKRSRNGQ